MRDICIRNAVAFSCPKLASLVELPLKRPDLVATPTGIPEAQVGEAKSRGALRQSRGGNRPRYASSRPSRDKRGHATRRAWELRQQTK